MVLTTCGLLRVESDADPSILQEHGIGWVVPGHPQASPSKIQG